MLVLLDLEVFELGPALLPAPRAEWTRVARAGVEPALRGLAEGRRIALLSPPEPADSEAAEAVAALQGALFLRAGAISRGEGVPVQGSFLGPRGLALPGVGEAGAAVARTTGAGHALLLVLRESRSTEALRLWNRWRASLGAPLGLRTRLFFGSASGVAVLAELGTGRILAAHVLVGGDPGPSLLDPDGVARVLKAVLGEPEAET